MRAIATICGVLLLSSSAWFKAARDDSALQRPDLLAGARPRTINMSTIGDEWEAGRMGIAEEHAASQIAYRIVARLGPRAAKRGVRKGTIVLGSTATELHSLPLSIAADLLRAAQFDVEGGQLAVRRG